MNPKEIARLVLYVAGGLLGLYLIYHGLVVVPDPQTVAVGAALAGVSGVAAPNVPTAKPAEIVVDYDTPLEAEALIESMQDAYADDGIGETVELDGDGDALDGSVEIGAPSGRYAADG